MSSFLTQEQRNSLTCTFDRLFEEMSTGRGCYVDVYKEPIQIVNNTTSLNLYGYSNDALNQTDITYQVVSGTFPCVIIYPNDVKDLAFPQIKSSLGENDVMLKVKQAARDYIVNGKTERVIVHGLTYDVIPYPKIQNYFGSLYYYFKCTERQ